MTIGLAEVSTLPHLNAALNATSAALLSAGYLLVRRQRFTAHRVCMLLAAAVSAAFLVSYSVYHLRAGSVEYGGSGWLRPLYFAILGTHAVLAVFVVPLALVTVYRGLTSQLARHRAIAHWAMPAWLYVSVTGVVVYFLLYHVS